MFRLLDQVMSSKSNQSGSELEYRYSPRLDIRQLRKTIYERGVVVVRDLIPKSDIDLFAKLTEQSYNTLDQILQILKISDDEPLETITDLRLQKFIMNVRIGQIDTHYFGVINGGRSIFDVLLNDAKRKNFIHSLLGGEWFSGAAQIRRVSPIQQQSKTWQGPISMHCDGPTLSRHTYSINFWVPLVDCVGDAPGLQLVPGPFKPMQEAVKHNWETNAVDSNLELEMQRLYSNGGDGLPRFVPRLKRGDVVLFHNWIMHATYISPEMTKPRTSYELRFNAPTRQHFEAFAT